MGVINSSGVLLSQFADKWYVRGTFYNTGTAGSNAGTGTALPALLYEVFGNLRGRFSSHTVLGVGDET